MTPEIVDNKVIYKAGELEDLPTIITFTSTTLELSNATIDLTIYVDKNVSKLKTLGRTKDGKLAFIEILYMKNYLGKKMAVLHVSLDKDYLFFPEKPDIK